jgi:hypothetical protein
MVSNQLPYSRHRAARGTFSFGRGNRFLPAAAVVRARSENDAGFFVLFRFLAVVRLIIGTATRQRVHRSYAGQPSPRRTAHPQVKPPSP